MIHEAVHRFRYLIELLNNSKDGLTVAEIERKLRLHGFEEISTERLRKLLRNMRDDTRLNINSVGTGYRDKWKGEYKASVIDLAATSSNKAVWLTMLAKTDISQVLPNIVRKELAPEQKKARKLIRYFKKTQDKEVLGWVERVRLGRPSVRLAVDREEPEVKPAVEIVVHDALTNRLALKIKYFSGHLSGELGEMLVYPIGLDCQLRWVTLVCQLAEPFRTELGTRSPKYGDDYVQMPMHRIQGAEIDERAKLPNSFDAQFNLQKYIERAEHDRPRGGEQRFTQGRKINFVALVTESYANDLYDSPLLTVGEPQKLVPDNNGWYKLTVELIQSDNLLWWCMAMAGDMVVLEPEDFRQGVISILDKGRSLYDHQSLVLNDGTAS